MYANKFKNIRKNIDRLFRDQINFCIQIENHIFEIFLKIKIYKLLIKIFYCKWFIFFRECSIINLYIKKI